MVKPDNEDAQEILAMQPTPGPWRVTQGTNGFCKTWQVSIATPTRAATIADCGAIINEVYQGSLKNYIGRIDNLEHKANAHLIAAAPELLAACEQVLIASEDGGDMEDIDWKQLRAVVAKATGKDACGK